MKHNDFWQEYALNDESIENGRYAVEKGNPPFGASVRLGGACIWLFRRVDGGIEVLSQKRSPHVANGGKWDVSAGGHIDYGETATEAAVREAREEIGIEISPEKLIHILTLPAFPKTTNDHNRNITSYHYLYDWTGEPDDFHFDDKEVAEVRWVPLEEFDDFAKKSLKSNWRDNHFLLELVKTWLMYYGNN